MRQIKLSLLALALAGFAAGCGKSNKAITKELTPEQIAEQEAAMKEVAGSEADHRKNTPKEKTQQETVDDAERAHARQQGRR